MVVEVVVVGEEVRSQCLVKGLVGEAVYAQARTRVGQGEVELRV